MLLYLVFLILKSTACDNSTINILSSTDNADGTFTYEIQLVIDFAIDPSYYGFVLQFNSSLATPVVSAYDDLINSSDLSDGDLTEDLLATTGSDVNSYVGLPAWTSYEELENVLSYENEESYSAISSDIALTLTVTTIGCVEEIVFDPHPTSDYCGTFTASSNCQSCNADVGTISVDINGSNVSGTDVDIPYGETATFNSSGYSLPNDGPLGTAGMVLALFSCEPEAASLISPFDIQNDPCYLGIVASDNVPTNNDGSGTSTYG